MADRPHRLPPSSDSTPSKKSTLKERARNALITGTAGGYLGGMLVEGTTRVKIPALTRKLLRLRRKTIGIHGARTGALAGALIGARNRGERSETADAVATGGDWKFSAFIEDMTFSALSKDVQTEVLRFVDAKKGTPVVHYGMGVKELLAKADAVNLASARKALGTLRASRARDEVLGKIKDGSKYILLMNDRIVDGHHFLAKAERGNVTSSLNVLDLTPARLSTGKVTEFAGDKVERPWRARGYLRGAGMMAGGMVGGAVASKAADALKMPTHVRKGRVLMPSGKRFAVRMAGGLAGLAVGGAAGDKLGNKLKIKEKGAKDLRDAVKEGEYTRANMASYLKSGVFGAGAGLAVGGLLKGRRGVTKIAAGAGAAAGVGARAGLQKKINREEDRHLNDPKRHKVGATLKSAMKHAGLNAAVPLASGGVIAGAIVAKRKNIGKHLANSKTGRQVRAWLNKEARRKNPVKRTKVVPKGKGPILDAATGEKFPALPQKRFETRFGILGAKGNHMRPTILKDVPNLPPGMAAYQVPAGVRHTNKQIAKKGLPADWQDKSKARKVGRILESGAPMPEAGVKLSGYKSEQDMKKALRRHELVHSIQSSKRGYRSHKRLRDLVKDEVGAYGTMNRRVKGGSKVLRAVNAAAGVPLSVGMGIIGNKKLQDRALLRGAQGSILAGGAMVAGGSMMMRREKAKKLKEMGWTPFDENGLQHGLLAYREFAEAEPRRNRTRDLRDKIGLAKDVAGLGVIGGAGYGAHRLYKKGSAAVAQAGPKIDAAMQQVKDTAAGWKQTADVTNKNVQSVGDLARGVKGKLDRLTQEKTIRARVHARGKKQGKGWLRRMFGKGAKLLGDAPKAKLGILGRMLDDPSPLTQFSEERKAQWNAALLGAAAPVAAGGLVLGTRGGRNALRGLLSKVDKGDPRRVRRVVLNQKRKDASIRRNADKAVGKAREQFRAEALPKAPKEPGLKDAVKTVRKRVKGRIVNAVANIGANPAEVQMRTGVSALPSHAFEAAPRDKLSKARDAALLTAGVAGTGAVVYGAHKLRGLKSSPTLRKGKAIAENVRNATSITADAGRIYNYLKEPVVRPKRIVAGMRRGWKQGMKEGQSAPAPKWKKGVIKIGKKLRLLESASPSLRFSRSPRLQSFAIGGLVGSGIGTLIGSQIGERFKYKTRNMLKKKLIPKIGQKWGRRVARAGAFIPENAGAVAGGVVGSIAGGGIRRTEMRNAEGGMTNFGGNEQLVDIDSSGFIRPLDQLTGRKKGYSRTKVKDYHRIRRQLDAVADGSKKLSPEAVARMKERMKNIRDNPEDAAVGQVVRSALREGSKVAKWTGRGRSLVKDASAHLRGEAREKDQWGRTKKREWEKGWFNNAKGAAAAGGALVGGALLLRAKPKLRAKIDRTKRQVTRTVNHAVEGKDLNLLPRMDKKWKSKELKNFQPWTGGQKRGAMTQPWPKTAKGVPVKSGTPKARAKFEKTRDLFSKSAENIAQGVAQVNSAKKLKKFAVLGGRLIQLSEDPLDVGWDLRDARGRSARVFAPGAGSRDRRPKKWHEKVENERKLWSAAALTGTLSGVAATRKLLKSSSNKELKRRLAQVGAAVKKNYVPKSTVEKSKIIKGSFKQRSPPAAA